MAMGGYVMAARVQLGHIAVPAKNPERLARFYADFIGLDITLAGSVPAMGDVVFLTDRPGDEMQRLALMTRPEAAHIAWRVESLADLKCYYAEARAGGVPTVFALNHGVTLSLYLRDPEGNGVELFWPTGQVPSGMQAQPVDLDQPEAALLALVGAPDSA
jgi:catechol-2,3-dioxygenase